MYSLIIYLYIVGFFFYLIVRFMFLRTAHWRIVESGRSEWRVMARVRVYSLELHIAFGVWRLV